MNTEEELKTFRKTWKNELANNCQAMQSTAKQLYMRGVQLEREGYCYEAIEYFRHAFKLDPDIEKHIDIRNDFCTNTSTDNPHILGFQEDLKDKTASSPQPEQKKLQKGNCNITELVFTDTYTCIADKVRPGVHISALPNEVLLLVLRFVISTELDFKSIESIAGVCKWFYNLARTPQLWKAACMKVWPDEQATCTGWRKLFISKPHLRFDGVYMNRIKYHRLGEHRPNHCCTLQTVFYHRFLRFFSDGLVMGLTSTSPPQQIVSTLKDRATSNKDVMFGKYSVSGDIVKLALYRRDKSTRLPIKLKSDCSYNITLQIVRKNGKQSLRWLEYYTIEKKQNATTKNCIELEPPHFSKAYVFSRVKSYSAVSVGSI